MTRAAMGALVCFAVSFALVGVRGEVEPEIIVLGLALAVVAAGRFGGRAGGAAGALVAALNYDFFFTRPYLSLKIAAARDVEATLVLLAVGLVAGGLSAQAWRDRRKAQSRELDVDAIRRLLEVAGTSTAEDVELAVRAELLKLLELSDCSFIRTPVSLPVLSPTGGLPRAPLVFRRDGFQLPTQGVAIAVTAAGQRLGSLICTPIPGVGIALARRRSAVAAAHILGLAMVAGAGPSGGLR